MKKPLEIISEKEFSIMYYRTYLVKKTLMSQETCHNIILEISLGRRNNKRREYE